jgi:hypothetical protein
MLSIVFVSDPWQHLDPMKLSKHRHLFWGLLAHFYKEYLTLAVLIFFRVVAGFAAPFGINRLLTYIETGGVGAVIRPWVWILWLFLGPLVSSTAMQAYIFLNTRNLVRIEAIITQLVFEHSLRIRMKEEAPAETQNEGTTVVPTPEPEGATAVVAAGTSAHSTDETTVVGRGTSGHSPTTSNSKGKGKQRKASPVAPSATPSAAGKPEKKQENLVGKINNFISTDLGNITEARDLLFMIWYTPLQIAICVWFLYSILGVAWVIDSA